MRFLAALFAVLLLFGCLGGGPTPQPPASNGTNVTNQTGPPVQIIVGQQQNQTAGQNVTQEQPPPPTPPGFEYENNPNQTLGIYFIDVGGPGLHGNAILIKKGDLDVLVDAGSAEKGGKVVDFLRSRSVDDIELLISTTADPRNYGGIPAVADTFTIENFWWGDDSFGNADYAAIFDRMSNSTKDARGVEEGFSQELNGIRFEVLNPSSTLRFDDINNDAIVLRVTDRNFSLLLTSNIQTGAQGKILNEQSGKIKAEVMQAPYYGVGAGTSNIGIFLLTAKPRDMIITGSADETAPNGGSRDPFRRLMNMSQYDIRYYEVYKSGTTRVTTDGQTYAIQALGK